MLSSVALLPLAALFSVSRALSLDFSAQLTAITAAAVSPTTGTYLIKNVGTGEYLYLARDGQVGAYLGSAKTGIHIQTMVNAGITGVILKGTSSETLKCLASQWNFETGGARNQFAVPYECQIGSDGVGTYGDDSSGNDSNKEFWVINAVKSVLSLSASATIGNTTLTGGLSLGFDGLKSNIKVSDSSDDDDDDNPKTSKKTIKKASKKTKAKAAAKKAKAANSSKAANSTQSTKSKSSSRAVHHADVARSMIEQRASKEPTYYTIHPVNHLGDMATLALAGTSATGFGDMPALELSLVDSTDKKQWWSMVSQD
ncbi:hypothetical protein RQP46_011407 [Phenoliferia psychrophenolica]